jgi:hypothetical protein
VCCFKNDKLMTGRLKATLIIIINILFEILKIKVVLKPKSSSSGIIVTLDVSECGKWQ